MPPTRPAVGLVGAGNLGRAIGQNLLAQGWPVLVHDRSPQRVELLVQEGARAADEDALGSCELIVFAVPDERAIGHLLRPDGELLPQLGERHTVVVHSTVVPSRVKELAAVVGATGARFLDAPVTGGAERARSGDLTLFVGADDDALAAARLLLEAVGSEVVHLGPPGAGAATKLANQLVMFGALGALQEALALAATHEVAEDALLQAISTGTADTWVGRSWGFFDRVARDYDEAGVALDDRPWVKDLQEVLDAAAEAGTEVPVAQVLASVVADRIETHSHEAAGDAVAAR